MVNLLATCKSLLLFIKFNLNLKISPQITIKYRGARLFVVHSIQ